MKAGIIVFPGSNCDRDVYDAIKNTCKIEPLMIWHKDSVLPELDLIVIPGGFSYGDYLRCGAIASKSRIMQEVIDRANKGVKVLGICNGFQILTETGLLPGALMCNKSLKFICKPVNLKVENTNTVFTEAYKKDQIISLAIAHHDGNYVADQDTLKKLNDTGSVIFRYVDEHGKVTENANPNGAMDNIAGICNYNKNVLGMMPHPERRSDRLTGGMDGSLIFKQLAENFL